MQVESVMDENPETGFSRFVRIRTYGVNRSENTCFMNRLTRLAVLDDGSRRAIIVADVTAIIVKPCLFELVRQARTVGVEMIKVRPAPRLDLAMTQNELHGS